MPPPHSEIIIGLNGRENSSILTTTEGKSTCKIVVGLKIAPVRPKSGGHQIARSCSKVGKKSKAIRRVPLEGSI